MTELIVKGGNALDVLDIEIAMFSPVPCSSHSLGDKVVPSQVKLSQVKLSQLDAENDDG